MALLAASLLGLAWALVWWLSFRNPPREVGLSRHVLPWGKLWTNQNVWGLCLMYGFGGFAANFFTTFLPDYLTNVRQLLPLQVKWLTGAPLACGVVACVVGGVISDAIIRLTGNRKWGRRLNGSVGLFVAGAALGATNFADSVWLLGGLLCLTFICNDLAMGPAWAACADIGERSAGTLAGLMNMVGALAGALGNLVAGELFQRGYAQTLFVIFGGSFAMAALSWLLIDATKPLEEKP